MTIPTLAPHVPSEPSPLSPFLANLTPKSLSTLVAHPGGLPLRIAPPLTAHAGLLSFFDRVQEENLGEETYGAGGRVGQAEGLDVCLGEGSERVNGQSQIDSTTFDHDWDRLTLCTEPVLRYGAETKEESGLGVWKLRGLFQGVWGGNFAFLDFDAYR